MIDWRRFTLVSFLGLLPLSACSDDDSTDNNSGTAGTAGQSGGQGGSSGESGQGGQSALGGSAGGVTMGGSSGSSGNSGASGNAGTSGNSGTGGDAGTSGTGANGGSAGQSGNSGSAGNAGASGNAGNSGTGGTNVAGNSGSGGSTGGSAGVAGTAGSGGQSSGGFAEIVPKSLYEEMLPNRNALYTWESLVEAANSWPTFCNEGDLDTRRREAAAFLANISHETTGGWPAAPGGPYSWGMYFIQEVGCENGQCTWYCDPSNAQYPCAPGKTYHGRGPIQLSWNYNYGAVGDQLGLDLLNNPDLVVSDGVTAFKTGIWFWMTAQPPKPSAHDVMVGTWTPSSQDTSLGRLPGFGMTINIINGGIECQQPTPPQVTDRVGFYERYTGLLGTTMGDNVYCDQMNHY